MNLKQILAEVIDIIPELAEHPDIDVQVLKGAGIIPMKTRDPREPMRMKKLKVERQLREVFKKRFARQLYVLQYNGPIAYKAKPKPKLPIQLPDWEEEEWMDELVAIIYTATKYGVELFSNSISIGIDYTLSNVNALNFARKYAGKLVKGIDDTTQEIIGNAISSFIDTPGFTIGDIMDELTKFSEKRASAIAVTETTRAFAEGQMEAARQFQKEFPDFTVLKSWETNNDDRVCDICGPLQGEEVPVEDKFSSGDMEPPAHVNCRCWINHYTKEARDAASG